MSLSMIALMLENKELLRCLEGAKIVNAILLHKLGGSAVIERHEVESVANDFPGLDHTEQGDKIHVKLVSAEVMKARKAEKEAKNG